MLKNNRNNKFIVVEGLDGAGKTTAILSALGELSERFNVSYLKSVGGNSYWGELARRHPSTFLFLVELLWVTNHGLRPALNRGKNVLMDKYFYNVASHIPVVNTKINKTLIKIFKSLMIEPDLVVYFKVSLEERLKRLKKAPFNKFHEALINNPEWAREREQAYSIMVARSDINTVYLDTTGKSEEEVAEELKTIIRIYLSRRW